MAKIITHLEKQFYYISIHLSTYVVSDKRILIYTLFEVVRVSEMQLDPLIVGEVIAKYRKRKGVSQEVLSGLRARIKNGEAKLKEIL